MAERGDRRRILVLAPFPPSLDGRNGGSRAIARLIRGLSERHDVSLACLRAEDEATVGRETEERCEHVLVRRRPGVSGSAIRPLTRIPVVTFRLARGVPLWIAGRWHARFAAELRSFTRMWKPDVVQAEFTAMGGYLAAAQRGALRVVTVHEPGSGAALERATESNAVLRWFWQSDARRWRNHDASVLRAADAAVVLTERDAREMRRLGARAHIAHIPIAPDLPPEPYDAHGTSPPELLFVGNFAHPPNLDAALHLARDIFPRIRARHPDVVLRLVGDAAPDALRAASGDGIEVTGWVDDLRPHLQHAAAVLAPLRLGGGMRVKVMDALAAGKAVVAYPSAVEGFDIVPGRDALVAPDADAFLSAVDQLLRYPLRRVQLGRAARAWAEAAAAAHASAIAYDRLYDTLLRLRRRRAGERAVAL